MLHNRREVTAATAAAAAAAAANLSGPPVTAVWVALGTTMRRKRAGVSDAASVDGGTMAALMSALAAAVAGGASTAVIDAGDRLATLTAVASVIGAHAAANPWVRVEMVAPGGVLALTAVLVALPLPPPADGAASRPPPQPPPSPPVLAAPAAVAATLRVATRGSEATKFAVDAPLPADGGGRSGLDVVRGTPVAATVAAAAAGGAAAGVRPAAIAATAMVWSLLTADNA